MGVKMKVLKRNQVIIFVLALMLVTAGYLSSTDNMESEMVSGNEIDNTSTIGDATLVNGGALVNNDDNINEIIESNIVLENSKLENNVVQTSTNKTKEEDTYFASSRLQRDTMYSQMLESYQKMIDSTSITGEQKAIAQNEITKINNNKNAIMIAENIIKTKGFDDIVIFINNDSISAVVKADKLLAEDIAQIQNVIGRELKADIENIHISSK